jgi:hypothetical protein
MRLDQISANPRSDRQHRWRVFVTATCALGFILALTSDVWARSSGGRYGGRAGFSQARRGFEGGGGSPSTMPSRPYSGRGSLGYPVPSPSPGYPLPIPIPVPSPGFGPPSYVPTPFGAGVTSGGGLGLGGIVGFLLLLGIVVIVGKVLLQHLSGARRDRAGRPRLEPGATGATPS